MFFFLNYNKGYELVLNQFVLGKPLWFFVWDPTIGGSLPAAAAFRTQVGGSARTSVRLQEDRG